jgi:glucosamine-6-phosphate isomerase
MNKEGHIDFSEVQTFNLDEYYKLPRTNDQSYYYFMHENLFNHININHQNVHIPNGMANDIEFECERYDEAIKESGGIDIQVLGIGNNAHIGFNEPTINFEKGTHLVVTGIKRGEIFIPKVYKNTGFDAILKAVLNDQGQVDYLVRKSGGADAN